jgi:ubiquinone/menaquinone biosynthesis C-methylase UbiE
MTNETEEPSPRLFLDTLNAYQQTAAIAAAVELDMFTAIGDSGATASEVAQRIGASARGTRILCDYLTLLGFLSKNGDRYGLTPDSAMFLSRKSPAYAGGMTKFLLSGELTRGFDKLPDAVRKGGTADTEMGTTAAEHPVWVEFARAMAPMMMPGSQALAEMVPIDGSRPSKVLDIAASHGMWGIAFAKKYPRASVTAVDWAPVLEVARENAQKAGVADRFGTIAGNAFEVDLGSGHDVALIPNFLHHFNKEDCVRFLKRVQAALREEGRVAIAEFVPNPDRVSPPEAAGFALIMLATTPEGDAYTLPEFEEMLRQAGFGHVDAHPLPPISTAVIAKKSGK